MKITTKNLTYLIIPKFGTYSKAMVPIGPVPVPVLLVQSIRPSQFGSNLPNFGLFQFKEPVP